MSCTRSRGRTRPGARATRGSGRARGSPGRTGTAGGGPPRGFEAGEEDDRVRPPWSAPGPAPAQVLGGPEARLPDLLVVEVPEPPPVRVREAEPADDGPGLEPQDRDGPDPRDRGVRGEDREAPPPPEEALPVLQGQGGAGIPHHEELTH